MESVGMFIEKLKEQRRKTAAASYPAIQGCAPRGVHLGLLAVGLYPLGESRFFFVETVMDNKAPSEDLIHAARLLSSELGQVVFLTRRPPLRIDGEPWCITIKKDRYNSEWSIHPEGGAMLEEDVYS